MVDQINRIALIGAGNLGSHLALSLFGSGIDIVQVFSRKISKAQNLARAVNSTATDQLDEIMPGLDAYLLCVNDNAIREVSLQLIEIVRKEAFVIHFSGSQPSTILDVGFEYFGVLYPLQTFSSGGTMKMDLVPVLYTANTESRDEQLAMLGSRISSNVKKVEDSDRFYLHLAAVFANNFTNHMYYQAKSICLERGLDFQLLLPIINSTAEKVRFVDPENAQTGPAKRMDTETIQKHLFALANRENEKVLYETCTKSILKLYGGLASHSE